MPTTQFETICVNCVRSGILTLMKSLSVFGVVRLSGAQHGTCYAPQSQKSLACIYFNSSIFVHTCQIGVECYNCYEAVL